MGHQTRKILVVKGKSAYNVLRKALDDVCLGFQNSGYQIELVDAIEEGATEHLLECMERLDEFAFYFSIQAIGFDGEQTNLPQLRTIRRVGWIVDDPVYHAGRLIGSTGERARILSVRVSHTERMRREYAKFEQIQTLFHGGFASGGLPKYEEKDIAVFFPGTYESIAEAEERIHNMGGIFAVLAEKVKERIIGENLRSVWNEKLYEYLEEIEFAMSEEEYHIIWQYMAPLDMYQRAYMRHEIMEKLLTNGIEVSVVGSGWGKYDGGGKENLHILSDTGVDITEVITLMRRSKVVLNNTNIIDGMHERIFTAMLAGAVCVTNEYQLLEDFFSNGKELVTFPLNELERLPEIVMDLLKYPQKAERIAFAGYQAAKEHHTWERRGEQIADWMENGQEFSY